MKLCKKKSDRVLTKHKRPIEGTPQLAGRIYRILFNEDDGLNDFYLSKRLEIPTSKINDALAYLKAHNSVIHAHQRWYVMDETLHPNDLLLPKSVEDAIPDATATEQPIEQPIIAANESCGFDPYRIVNPNSTIRRLESWLLSLSDHDKPKTTGELTVMLDTNRNTLQKAIKKLIAEGNSIIVQRIDTHILKMHGNASSVSVVQKKPVADQKEVTNDKQPPKPARWDLLLTEELRTWLRPMQLPEPHQATQWLETLSAITTVFQEIGIPVQHRFCHDISEMSAWLQTKNS